MKDQSNCGITTLINAPDFERSSKFVACDTTDPWCTDSSVETIQVSYRRKRKIRVDSKTFTLCSKNNVPYGSIEVTSFCGEYLVLIIDHDMDDCLDHAFYRNPLGVC